MAENIILARLPTLGGVTTSSGAADANKFPILNGSGILDSSFLSGLAGAGTVTSVAITLPAWLTVSGSPITSNGTLEVTATTGQTANSFLATPDGSTGIVGLRNIVMADFPSSGTLPAYNGSALTSLNASNIASGTVAIGRIPTGTSSSTVAIGNDSRITGALQSSSNLSDVASLATTQTNLGAGAANGLATLDSSSKLTAGQIPTSLLGAMVYQSGWNANTNSPTLISSTGTKGYFYIVTTAGTTTLDGISSWLVGDWVVFNGTTWTRLNGSTTSPVVSVAGRTGAITLSYSDISGLVASATTDTTNASNITSGTLSASRIPTLNQNTTGSAGSVVGLTITSGKTLSISNTLTLAGTDSSTLNIGSGGTLGSNAFTSTTYQTPHTTLAGYGITDPVVLTSGAYSNPSWITSLAYSKISGVPSLPVASGTVLGGVKQGANVTIAGDGTLSVASTVTSLPFSSITSTPTTLVGYGITDPIVLTSGSYANPSWISSLDFSKLASLPTTLSGYGITDPIVLTTGSYANPSWITSFAWSKISSKPTTLSGYGITDPIVLTSGEYADPAWITSINWSKLTGSIPIATTSVLGEVIISTGLSVSGGGAVSVNYGTTSGTALQGNAIGTTVEQWSSALDAIVYNTGGLDISGTSLSLPENCVSVYNINASGSPTSSYFLRGDGSWNLIGVSNISALGTPSSTTFLRGDGQWESVSLYTGTVTSVAMSLPYTLSLSGSPITTSGTLAVTMSGTPLAVADGGTGNNSFIVNNAPVFTGSSSGGAWQSSSTAGTVGQVLISQGAGAIAEFGNPNAWTFITANHGATCGEKIAVVTSSGALTVTLPSYPTAQNGDSVVIADILGTSQIFGSGSAYTGFSSNNLTVYSPVDYISYAGNNIGFYQYLTQDYLVATFTYYNGFWVYTDSLQQSGNRVAATLASGTVTVTNPNITTTSVITASHKGTSVTNAGALYVHNLSSGSVTIKSTNASDNDTIMVLIQ